MFASVTDSRILATPDLLDGKINLVNALPVAGFLTRPDEEDRDYQNDYIRCVKLSVKAGSTDHIVSILKEGMSSVPEILSFLVFKPFDEVDILYVWERYASLSAFAEIENGPNFSKVIGEITPLIVGEEITAYRVAGGYLSK